MALKMTRPTRLPEGADRFLWTAVPVPVPPPVSFAAVLKFDPNQARDPKGTPTGGRFARGPIEQKYRDFMAFVRNEERHELNWERKRKANIEAWRLWSEDLKNRKKPLKPDGAAAKKLDSYKHAQALENELHAADDARRKQTTEARRQARALLKVAPDQRSTVKFIPDTQSPLGPITTAAADRALATFREFDGSGAFIPHKFPGDKIDQLRAAFGEVTLEQNPDGTYSIPKVLRLGKAASGRAHATAMGIQVGGKDTEHEVFHETAHHIEIESFDVLQAALAYREARATQPREIFPLNTVNRNYGPDEIAVRGNFSEPYIAKIYPSDMSTEVVSIGVAKYLMDPVTFARNDPDHFKFIFDVMHGKYRKAA